MNILILDFDIFAKNGGGQKVYREIILNNPQYTFYFFGKKSNPNLPNNVYIVPFQHFLIRNCFLKIQNPLVKSAAHVTTGMALSLKKYFQNKIPFFDVIDIADYNLLGVTVKEIFNYFNINYGPVVLALHGTLKNTIQYRGNDYSHALSYLQEGLELQKASVDFFYGISEWYVKQEYKDRDVLLINPLDLYYKNYVVQNYKEKALPNILFLGRLEYTKGLDILIDTCNWVNKALFNKIIIIGGDDENIIENVKIMALKRNIEIEYHGNMAPEEVYKNFLSKQNNVVVVPSRFDSFNLVALESMLCGNPVLVSDQIGITEFVKHCQPKQCLEIARFDNGYSAAKTLAKILLNYYHIYKKNAITTAQELQCASKKYHPIKNLYSVILKKKPKITTYHHCIIADKITYIRMPFFETLKKMRHLKVLSRVKSIKDKVRKALNCFRRILIKRDLKQIDNLSSGNVLLFLCYLLRMIRYNLTNQYYTLTAQNILRREKLNETAKVASLFDLPPKDQTKYLMQRLILLKDQKIPKHYTFQDDKRKSKTYKVSVIVSAYNISSKIENFLQALSLQTMDTTKYELIIVECNSKEPDYKSFKGVINRYKLSFEYLYVRTKTLETIQAAWNRGINLSRGEYLVFLGVDEGITPQCLDSLSKELDENHDVDWIMSDSIVTEVDNNGGFKYDVMKYNREGLKHFSPYLECCYLSYVGGMYRKSIHDRFGYYDTKFKAAGDTEFKNRILPYIQTKHVPQPFGQFFNYPEARSSEGFKIEIEDLRAWYIYRTEGGFRYLTNDKDNQYLQSILIECLRYRKSYCQHYSTDINIAIHASNVLYERTKQNKYKILNEDLKKIWNLYTNLRNSKIILLPWYKLVLAIFKKKHKRLLSIQFKPEYGIFNDNIFEQHSWLW